MPAAVGASIIGGDIMVRTAGGAAEASHGGSILSHEESGPISFQSRTVVDGCSAMIIKVEAFQPYGQQSAVDPQQNTGLRHAQIGTEQSHNARDSNRAQSPISPWPVVTSRVSEERSTSVPTQSFSTGAGESSPASKAGAAGIGGVKAGPGGDPRVHQVPVAAAPAGILVFGGAVAGIGTAAPSLVCGRCVKETDVK